MSAQKKNNRTLMWAPWRMPYVKKASKNKDKGCLFCRKYRSKNDRSDYVIERREHVFSLLNIYPYNNGHLLVAPRRHISDLAALTEPELLELMQLVVSMQELLKKKIRPHGFNVGINCGLVAGAGIEDHLHIHIVPRWNGDTSFISVCADLKIIPQSLDALYTVLKK